MGTGAESYDEAQAVALRDGAAVESLSRIDRDLERASPKIKPHLAMIRKELFQSSLNAARVLLACPGSPTTIKVCFHRETGESIADYIEKERVATALRLVRDTELSLDVIAEKVGICDRSNLSDAFKRLVGMRPSALEKSPRIKSAKVSR